MNRKHIWPGVILTAAVVVLLVLFSSSHRTEKSPESTVAEAGESTQTFSYEPYAAVLGTYVDDDGMVDYEGLKADRKNLYAFVRALGVLDREEFDSWSDDAKIAFWINAYNSLTLEAIINHYPIEVSIFNPKRLLYPANSIRQIGGVWDETEHKVPGEELTLDRIEHEVLRKNFNEPRIHMALVCAAMGCPPLRNEPYTGEELDVQLDDQSEKFLANPEKLRIDREAARVYLSPIFKWFGEDFVETYKPETGYSGHSDSERAVLNFAAAYLDEDDAWYLQNENYEIEYLDYDWSLNEQG